MKGAKPIKSKHQVNKLLEHIKKENTRDYIIAWIGFNYGLRIGDIVPLGKDNIKNGSLVLIEEKSGLLRKFPASQLINKLERYLDPNLSHWFLSRQVNSKGEKVNITTTQFYRRFRQYGKDLGIKVSTHTMRKTFAYHFYKKYRDLVFLNRVLGHDSLDVTAMYLPNDLFENNHRKKEILLF